MGSGLDASPDRRPKIPALNDSDDENVPNSSIKKPDTISVGLSAVENRPFLSENMLAMQNMLSRIVE